MDDFEKFTFEIFTKGVTMEMMGWFMGWMSHPDPEIRQERYKLWHPVDHVSQEPFDPPEDYKDLGRLMVIKEKFGDEIMTAYVRMGYPSTPPIPTTAPIVLLSTQYAPPDYKMVNYLVNEVWEEPDGVRMKRTILYYHGEPFGPGYKTPVEEFLKFAVAHCNEEAENGAIIIPYLYKWRETLS